MPRTPKTFDTPKVIRGTKQQRGYGGTWERVSMGYRRTHPVCEVCNDDTSMAVHHVIPFNGIDDPLRLSINNLQAVCLRCHYDLHGKRVIH
jgi:5-methylcytosine-specific restriction endonuclease McrA